MPAQTAPQQSLTPPQVLIRLPEVRARTGLGKSTIYALIATGNFPAPRQIGPRAVGWLASEVDDWVRARPVVAYAPAAAPTTNNSSGTVG